MDTSCRISQKILKRNTGVSYVVKQAIKGQGRQLNGERRWEISENFRENKIL